MAYAGQPQQGQAPASAEINRVAGAPQGLGQARPPASEVAAPTPQERSALAGLLPVKFGTRTVANPKGEEFGGVGEFLTSRQFVQPLLEGIGAMASSPSLSGVGAALQGLGAASRAYTGLEKAQADLARSEAETEQTRERTSEIQQLQQKGDLFIGPTGPMVLMPGGRQISMGEWIAQGRPPTRSQSQGKITPGQPPAPGSATGTGAPAPSLPQSISSLAEENAKYVNNTNIAGLTRDKETNDPFTPASALANRIYGNRMQTMAFAKALADLPSGGPITAELINPIKQRVVDLLKLAGVPEGSLPDIKNDVAALDIVNKVRNSLATSGVRGPAVEELNKVLGSIPGDFNSKDGQAQLISSFLVEQQEAREKARMFNDYRRLMEQKYGVSSEYSQYSGRGLNDAFETSMRARYQDDKANLAKMFNDFILDRNRQPARILDGKPATVMSYLIANSGRIPNKALEAALIAQYGEENIRRAQQYFGG
jgi:hypothetical protein